MAFKGPFQPKLFYDLSSVQQTGQVGIKSSFHVNDNLKTISEEELLKKHKSCSARF